MAKKEKAKKPEEPAADAAGEGGEAAPAKKKMAGKTHGQTFRDVMAALSNAAA